MRRSDARLTAAALHQETPRIKDLPHQSWASTILFATILCRSLTDLVDRAKPCLKETEIYALLCQEPSSGEKRRKALYLPHEGFTGAYLNYPPLTTEEIWFIIKCQSQRILNIFIFPSTLDSFLLKLLLGECHSNSSYLTIYSPFLLHYPKWNRLAITEPAHAILYSLQFPTSHLKKQILHCYLKIY